MGKLFSPLSLLDEHTAIVSIESTDSYIDQSFFIESLDFLSEQHRLLSVSNVDLYKSISESGNDPIIIREAFSEFFDKIKSFIQAVIKFIKKLIAKFWVKINSMFLNDRYIENHKGELGKFSAKEEFDISGYIFTFKETIPSIDVLQDLEKSISEFKVNGRSGSYTDLKKSYDSFVNEKNSNSYLDDLRKKCIDAKSGINDTDFREELFKVYRGGDASPDKITVTKSVCDEALVFFTGYEKLKTATERYSKNVERIYDHIQNTLSKVTTSLSNGEKSVSVGDFVDRDISSDKVALYDLFMKAKSQEISAISNIHIMAFSTKLDALKACFGQDKKILYGAFKKILSAKNEVTKVSDIPDEFRDDVMDDDVDGVLNDGGIGSKLMNEKTNLSSADRKCLPDSAFGLQKERKYPLTDAEGKPTANAIDSAIHLFCKCPDDRKPALARRIKLFAARAGAEVPPESEVAKCAKGGNK